MPARILSVFFQPPMAIARLGGSDTPLEAFTWKEDPSLHGAGRTVIEPVPSLEVHRDGSVRPYLPSLIRFRDGDLLRPVAPFFELWAVVETAPGMTDEQPVTTRLLHELGSSLEAVTYRVHAANLKAARRTGDPACGFSALVEFRASQHAPKPLLAWSPRTPNSEPLVVVDHPIRLGQVQGVRPVPISEMGIDLDVLRLRFTPAIGQVYGPPSATTAPAPQTGRDHTIVSEQNRILNPRASWLTYDADYARFTNPEPSDTYDGADIDADRSWGVVDDTCDVVIESRSGHTVPPHWTGTRSWDRNRGI